MTDRCIVCGSEIPEGRQVCPICESEGLKHNRIAKSAAGTWQERNLEEKGVQVTPIPRNATQSVLAASVRMARV